MEPIADAEPLRPLLEPADGVPDVTSTPEALAEVTAALAAGTGPVAVDVERASGYRYGQSAYLVQLRREGAGTVLIDPVPLRDLSELGAALAGTEWVLHAANQDLPSLRALGLVPDALFDTELAARLLGRDRVGLGHIVAEELGITLAKEHSAADWSTRPLPADWLRYAALDVELLVELRDRLAADLAAAGKLEWAQEEFEAVRTAPPAPPRVDPWRRTSGMHTVRTDRGAAVVREMWQAREDLARRVDRSPGRVLPDAAIVAAAHALPASESDLLALPPFTGRGARRHAAHWWGAVERALALPREELPPRRAPGDPTTPPPPRAWAAKAPDAAARLEAVRGAVRGLAAEVAVPQENLLAPAIQRQLAWTPPEATESAVAEAMTALGARRWQVALLAAPVAAALTATAD
ncbi:HRDC domain-containing protein [Georgenia faecalis]|uniref:HRDC domain-containing protein n=1 Tax=Georgenia faecalis TaxID=2483799 RepID=UPI000FD9092D|nr:HRDC domain-containing protein [Georgenia faecalis]